MRILDPGLGAEVFQIQPAHTPRARLLDAVRERWQEMAAEHLHHDVAGLGLLLASPRQHLHAGHGLLRLAGIEFGADGMKAVQIVDVETNRPAMFVDQLARQAPTDPDVAKVVDDVTKQIPGFPMIHAKAGVLAPESNVLMYDPHCRRCPRLAEFRDQVRAQYPDYACLPVPSLGPIEAPLLIVGLAPGLHGANASNRPFTGDGAGPLLYGTLTELGLARRSPPVAVSDPPGSIRADDGMTLVDCRICNSVKCLPPQNKPLPVEVRTCNAYLVAEIEAMRSLKVIIALGAVAHGAVLRALGHPLGAARFGHGARHMLGAHVLHDSYHCSRYNQNTGRLTPAMFRAVFERAAAEAGIGSGAGRP